MFETSSGKASGTHFRGRTPHLLDFMKTAMKDYMHTGTLFPSSNAAVKTIIQKIPFEAALVVEYGAGNGAITRRILDCVSPSCRVIACEVNEEFAATLRKIQDPRLTVLHADVRHSLKLLKDLAPAGIDAVISGIPFSFLTPDERSSLVRETFELLSDNGKFILYQNSPLMLKKLREQFESVHWSWEPRNLPPYFILEAS